MERNRWETAIRCLEVALHANTRDDEIIAAVNGFRRTADGTPLGDVCRALATSEPPDAAVARWQEKAAALAKENRELRRRLEREESRCAAAGRRVAEAERRLRELSEELRAAQGRGREIERAFADYRATMGAPPARGDRAEGAPARPKDPPPSFRQMLAAARLQSGQPAAPVADAARSPWRA
jgi:hypothetical protein